MNIGKEDIKEELIMWCSIYSNKEHLWTKDLFKVYQNRLKNKGNVTEKMFIHLVKYLKWDLKMDDEKLWEYFSPVIDGYSEVEAATLDEFIS